MKALLAILIYFSLHTVWANTLSIHGQQVVIKRMSGNTITGVRGAVIEQALTLVLGENTLKDIPAGSSLYFQENTGPKDNLLIAGLIVNAKMEDQEWSFRNGKKLQLNCGRYANGPAFIELSSEFDLLEGCKSTIDQSWGSFIINKRSNLDFFPSGELKGSTITSGAINLNNQNIALEPGLSLRFHNNGNLFYFHPAKGEEFTSQTELCNSTRFIQPEDQDSFAVMFHENGKLSTAIIKEQTSPLEIIVNMFGTDVNFPVGQGPIGFNEEGIVDRLSLKERLQFEVTKTTYVKSTETYYQIVSYGHFKPGMMLSIDKGEQLFINGTTEGKTLRAYTETGLQGLVYFNELSTETFRRN